MQLKKLEEELGIVLFDRSRKPVAPTADGERLLAQFRAVLREAARIDSIVQELRGEVGGTYRLGIIPTMAPTVLPRLVPAFTGQWPKVELRVEELTTEEIIRRLLDETLDGGILATPLHHPRVVEFPLFREDFALYHSPALDVPVDAHGRVDLGQLDMDRLLVMREGHCLRAQTLDLCTLGDTAAAERPFALEAGSMATLCAMVRQGRYFTILPALSGEELRAQGHGAQVREIAGDAPYREVALVSHRMETRRAVREALVEVARAVLEPLESVGRVRRSRPVSPHAG
jgi:LysR family hydrogen peroxide-inducible transcriptional activator